MARAEHVVCLVTLLSIVAPRAAFADDLQPIYASGKSLHHGTTGPHAEPDVALVCIGGAMVLVGFTALGIGLAMDEKRLAGPMEVSSAILMVGGFVLIFGALFTAEVPRAKPKTDVLARAFERPAPLAGPSFDDKPPLVVPIVSYAF